MAYYIDLESISLDAYRKKLENGYLPPSRMILKEKTDERFRYFKSIGIKNVKALILFLKKKDTFTELLQLELFSEPYLTNLLRELNSLHPKPTKIAEFSGISKDIVTKLEAIGIKNTEHLYDKVITKKDRQKLADTTGITIADIQELTKLTDISRIKWVGATYARILYTIGADSVDKISKSDPVELHAKINQCIKESTVFKGAIGLNDVRILVEIANELPSEIEFLIS